MPAVSGRAHGIAIEVNAAPNVRLAAALLGLLIAFCLTTNSLFAEVLIAFLWKS